MPADFRNDRVGLGAASLALLTAFLWGGLQPFIKIGLTGMPPLAMAAARFAVGLVVVAAAAALGRVALRANRADWAKLAGLSALFTLQIAFLNEGARLTSASRATVLMSAHPFFVALFCHAIVPGDRLTLTKLLGIGVAFGGLLSIFADGTAPGGDGYLSGDVLVLGSAVLLGLRQSVLKRLLHAMHPYAVLFWQSLLSLPAFCLLSLLLEEDAAWDLSGAVVGAILYQGVVVAGLCFILWTFLLRHHSASRLGVFALATPVSGVLLSVALLQDVLTVQLAVSVVLVAAGIAIVNWRD